MPSGFILHPTYYIEKGRPVVHLFGKDESGRTFVVRDDSVRPNFFIRESDLPAAQRLVDFPGEPCAFTSPGGDALHRVFVTKPPDAPGLRDRFESSGIETFEADIPFVTRYLMERGIRGSLRIEGTPRPGRLVDDIYFNPDLSPDDQVPELRLLSLDIETDPEISRLLSVGLWCEGRGEVLLNGTFDHPADGSIEVLECADETELLRRLHERIREIDPDILTGWNVIDFDLAVLERFCLRSRVPFTLGRADLPCRLRIDRASWGASRAIVPGRVVLDGLSLLRDAFIRLEDYRLDTAAREILGKGKTLGSDQRAEEILHAYEHDRVTFVEYNLNDARLVAEIIEARDLLGLAIRRSLLTGMPLDRVSASIASFDFLYLTELHKRGMVGPTVRSDREAAPTQGGFVFDSVPGIYENVAVFDYKSLYPSLIRSFRLDPLSVIQDDDIPEEPAPIAAPNGVRFRQTGGILPELLDRLFPLREEAQERGDRLTGQALKIMMNSFYGVLATPRCRFYSPETSNAITGFGQKILRWTRDLMETQGHPVLYGDTDSIFVDLGSARSQAEAEVEARRLAALTNETLTRQLAEEYGVTSKLELKFEKLFSKLILPSLRHSTQGSKKRYVGLVRDQDQERLDFVGLESVRRDWTQLAKNFQRELVWRVFREEPVEAYIREFLGSLRDGRMDELLVYRKALRKPSSEYTRTTPPHVQAARKMSRPPGRIIHYVFTEDGPEPAEERVAPFDYEHYVEKQLRPIAESILSLLGLRWEQIVGNQGTLPI